MEGIKKLASWQREEGHGRWAINRQPTALSPELEYSNYIL